MERITFNTSLALRLTSQTKQEFIDKATRSGRRPGDVLRMLIEAYIEGRLANLYTHNEGVS